MGTLMIKGAPAVLLALSASLSGCAKDYSLAPPADSEQVTVTVKVPKGLKAETMEVMYRSTTCKRITHGASGQRIELQGYHGFDIQLQQQGQSDLYSASLSVEGGGACKWQLSNVIFGVAYADLNRFGSDVTYGTGGGVVVMLDHNRSSRSHGLASKVEGDLMIKKDYYPWVKENFIGGYRKRVSLSGSGQIYLMYQALKARKIYFEPVLHSEYVTYSQGPKVKKEGRHTTFTYPDGSVECDGRSTPNFRKLQEMRLGPMAQL